MTRLVEILTQSQSYTFSDVLAIDPPVDWVAGLSVPSPAINLATLHLLAKATGSQGDAGIVAGKSDVVASLIKLWLCSPDAAVGDTSRRVLLGLLGLGSNSTSSIKKQDIRQLHADGNHPSPQSQSLMWRRLVKDKDIYSLLFSLCSMKTLAQADQPNAQAKTIAQGRLLDFLQDAKGFYQFKTSQIAEVEAAYGVTNGSLIDFALVHMVDFADDVLMHATLMNFFTAYISPDTEGGRHDPARCTETAPYSSECLDNLISRGLHSRTISYFLESSRHDAADLTYVYPRSAEYVAAYAANYPRHFLEADSFTAQQILTHLSRTLYAVPKSQWAHDFSQSNALHILSSSPRVALIPQFFSGRIEPPSPLFAIPTKPLNANALRALATIFRGPLKDLPVQFDEYIIPSRNVQDRNEPDRESQEKQAARALYLLYLEEYPSLWTAVISAAETIALDDCALAALDFLSALVAADWQPLPGEQPGESSVPFYRLPSEIQLERRCHLHKHPLPSSGVEALFTGPGAAEILEYLFKPAGITSLVGGGSRQNFASKIAHSKRSVSALLNQRMKEVNPINMEGAFDHESWGNLVIAVERLVSQDSSISYRQAGARIETLKL